MADSRRWSESREIRLMVDCRRRRRPSSPLYVLAISGSKRFTSASDTPGPRPNCMTCPVNPAGSEKSRLGEDVRSVTTGNMAGVSSSPPNALRRGPSESKQVLASMMPPTWDRSVSRLSMLDSDLGGDALPGIVYHLRCQQCHSRRDKSSLADTKHEGLFDPQLLKSLEESSGRIPISIARAVRFAAAVAKRLKSNQVQAIRERGLGELWLEECSICAKAVDQDQSWLGVNDFLGDMARNTGAVQMWDSYALCGESHD
jgi:hypothetical protein